MKLHASVESQRFERGLATARLLLAIGLLVWPSRLAVDGARAAARGGWALENDLVLIFVAHSATLLALCWSDFGYSWRSRLALHAADALWPLVFLASSGVMTERFVLVGAFALVAAAFRTGFHATVLTGGVITVLAVVHTLLLSSQTVANLLGGGVPVTERDLADRVPYLLLMLLGLALGYLVASERRFLAESTVLARLAAHIHGKQKANRVVSTVCTEIFRISGARRVVFIAEDAATGRALLSDVREEGGAVVTPRFVDPAERHAYLFPMAADCWHVIRLPWPRNRVDFVALDSRGQRIEDALYDSSGLLQRWPAMESIAVFSLGRRDWWHGRFLLVNPRLEGSRLRNLRFLQRLVHFVAPVIRERYMLQRLRSLAETHERLRLASELHDGVIQSLMAAELQVNAIRKSEAGSQSLNSAQLARVQQLLHEEALNLRDLMQRLKPVELEPDELLAALRDVIGRFERDTGITARLHAGIERVNLAPRTCATLVRIVQEALSNVRRHSGARGVMLSLAPEAGAVQLTIEDDGHGFSFASTQSAGPIVAPAPPGSQPRLTVIEECVRAIDGTLSVECGPQQGLRLRIQIPFPVQSPVSRPPSDALDTDFSHAAARWMTAAATVTAAPLHALWKWLSPGRLDWHRVPGKTK